MMKTMKKQVMMLCMAVLFVFILAPAVKAEAEESNGLQITTKKVEKSLGAYSGGYVSVSQTGATETTVTISWTPVQGAIGYRLEWVNGDLIKEIITETTYTIQLPQPNVYDMVKVYPVDVDGYYYTNFYGYTDVSTLPTKIENVDYYSGSVFGDKYKLAVSWNASPIADGYTLYCYNKSGKLVDQRDYPNSDNPSAYLEKTNTQNVYKVVVAGFIKMTNNQTVYGDESAPFYAVPQPKITSTKNDIKANSFNIKWKKVSGATKYDIYASYKKSSGYKKVASVKSSKNKYTIKKFKGKTVNMKKKLYVKVVTNAKIDGKTVKSANSLWISGVRKVTKVY